MLVFLFWLVLIILISLIILFLLEIKIEVVKLNIYYQEDDKRIEVLIKVKGYIFKYLKIFSFGINNKRIENIIKSKQFIKLYKKVLTKKSFDKKILKTTKEFLKNYKSKYNTLPVELEKMIIDLKIGLLNLETTVMLVAILGSVLSIPLIFTKNNIYKYQIVGDYKNSNIINIKLALESVIRIKLKRVIIIFFRIKKYYKDINKTCRGDFNRPHNKKERR